MSGKKRVFLFIVIVVMIVTLIAYKFRSVTKNRHLGSTINITTKSET